MILEMHCHTAEHSGCSQVTAAEVVQHNFNIGLHGTVLTDHHYLWTPEEIGELRGRLKVPDYYLILSGQEVMTPELGDVLVYGADVTIEKGTSLEAIRRHFPDAAIIWAHPYRDENIPPATSYFIPLSTASKYSARIIRWLKVPEDCVIGMTSSLLQLPELIPMH